jgi:hypothetical protein
MSAPKLLALVLVAACAVAAERVRAAQPDPTKLLLYNLLDLDQRELFEPQQYSPLAELNAWTDLYAALRDQARTDASADRRHLKGFMLVGWIARTRNHFATIGSFNIDLMELFEARPDDVLQVMAAQDFMLPEMCTYLARFFFYEKRDPEGRRQWESRHRKQIEARLGPDNAKRCLDAFWQVNP